MSELAKKARADSKAKAQRMINESTGKVDASDWSPSAPLNADKKTGMRPVSRSAFRSGGAACSGENPKQNAGRKPRASGGNVKSYATEDAKAANAEKFGKPHIGGFKSGGRTGRAPGGPVEVPTKRMTFGQNSPTPGQKNGGKVGKAGGGEVDGGDSGAPRTKIVDKLGGVAPTNPRYDFTAVQNAISSSNRSGRKIGGKEAAKIHALLRGGRKAGGSVSDGALEGTRPTGGREARATGGKVKKGTNINIIINSGPKPQDQAAMPPKPAMPPPPPPPPMPPMMPPGGAPPPGMMPPGGGGPPPMMRKRGGRTNYMSKEAGAGSGLARLQRQK